MSFDLAIFLAAAGITTLETVEAAAVALALYHDSKKPVAFFSVIAGSLVIFIPMFALGALITYLPEVAVRLTGGVLLLYFGTRLVKSARRSVYWSRKNSTFTEHFEKGLLATGFSVGAIEAFEAAIVLVGLLPNNFSSTVYGMGLGIVVVVVATAMLHNRVRKVKQANMKIFVSALLLSFSVFWFGESLSAFNILPTISDLILVPLFIFFTFVVYKIAYRPFPELIAEATKIEQAAS